MTRSFGSLFESHWLHMAALALLLAYLALRPSKAAPVPGAESHRRYGSLEAPMTLKARFQRLAQGFHCLASAFRKVPPPPPLAPRHSLNPQFATIREVIYHTWDMHEQAEVIVTLLLDRDQGLHIFMANATDQAPTPSLHDRVLNLLTSATGVVVAAVRAEKEN